MNGLTKQMWKDSHSYEQVYDYIDNRICDECVRQNAEAQVFTEPQLMRWRKQGWSSEEEVGELKGFLEEEEKRRRRDGTGERRGLRRMDMMEFVEKKREKQRCSNYADTLIPEEMGGILEDVDWDIQSRPKEAKMDTQVEKLLDGDWMDVKESRARVTQDSWWSRVEELVRAGRDW